MSDIKLFDISGGDAKELKGQVLELEKPLQSLIEANLENLLGVRFLATEYSTGKTHAGRIDSLGLDENACPVIIEYKRNISENVINQGLFYLDWLMDHQAEFKLLVMDRLGKDDVGAIDWSAPRLICIASDFTKYDSHAVQQINRNIELVRYKKFGKDLLLLELVNVASASGEVSKGSTSVGASDETPLSKSLKNMNDSVKVLFDLLESYVLSLGDDVQRKDLKRYVTYKRLRSFVSVIIFKSKLMLIIALEPDSVDPLEGITRDVTDIGHWGRGNLEITLRNKTDLDKVKNILRRAYEGV